MDEPKVTISRHGAERLAGGHLWIYKSDVERPPAAEPGDVVFFHYFTIHGSMPNRSDKTRKTVLVQLYAGDDRVEEGNAHPDERLALRGWNHFATRNRANVTK